jgi:hypothetical protein
MNHGMLCPNQLNHSFQIALIFKGQKNHSAGVWVDIEMAIPYLYKLQGTCKTCSPPFHGTVCMLWRGHMHGGTSFASHTIRLDPIIVWVGFFPVIWWEFFYCTPEWSTKLMTDLNVHCNNVPHGKKETRAWFWAPAKFF